MESELVRNLQFNHISVRFNENIFLQCIQTWKPREISPFRKLFSKPVSNKKI